jgi:predicted nucleotidyltransferase
MPAPPLEEMRVVARRLAPLDVPFAFVGGAAMCLLVDHPELTQFRRTDDVDVIVAVVTYIQFAQLEEKLRANGFAHDTTVGAPICRWIIEGCRVDIMPAEPANLGMNTRWFPEALQLAIAKDLGDGYSAKVVSPALFLATKLEAFKDRSKGDYYMSHDLEDIITLVDGCAAIVDDVKATQPDVKEFVANGIKEILKHPDFRDALPGHMVERLRIPLVMERFESVAALSPA